jgi:putative membrane protein
VFAKRVKEFAADANTRPAKTYRLANEVPTVLMIVIVVMIIARPF